MNETFEKYQKEMIEDVKFDRFNLTDKIMMIPGIKHKWVGRLINHKHQLSKLKRLKEQAKEKIINDEIQKSDVTLTKVLLDKKTDKHDLIRKINKKIEEEELTILYLDKIENIFRSASYDMSNMVDMIKMEET